MISHEFLLEYSRLITKQKMGDKILAAFAKIPTSSIPDKLQSYHLIVQAAEDPDRFDDQSFRRGWRIDIPGHGHQLIKYDNVRQLLAEYKDVIIDRILEFMETQMDPTRTKEYVPWMIRSMINDPRNGLSQVPNTYKEALAAYHMGKERNLIAPEHKDIGRIKDWSEFFSLMNTQYAPEEILINYDKIYDGPDATIVIPKNVYAARKLGSTFWCTKNQDSFDDYTAEGPLYIIIPKNPRYPHEKYQIHLPKNEFKNEQNDTVDEFELLGNRFRGAAQEIIRREPRVQHWAIFAPDNLIKGIWIKIMDAVRIHAFDLISNQQYEDEDYINLLQQQGCIDEAGEYDWDRIQRLGLTYIEYDSQSRRAIGELNKLESDTSSDRLRQQLIEYGNEERQEATVGELNIVASNMIGEQTSVENQDIFWNLSEYCLTNIRIVDTERLNSARRELQSVSRTTFYNLNQWVHLDRDATRYSEVGAFTVVIEK